MAKLVQQVTSKMKLEAFLLISLCIVINSCFSAELDLSQVVVCSVKETSLQQMVVVEIPEILITAPLSEAVKQPIRDERRQIILEQDALQALVAGDMSRQVRVPMPYCSTRARHEAIRDYDVCHF